MACASILKLVGTHFTDILCDRAEVWHLRRAGLLEVHPEARCPQTKLLGWSIQLQTVDSELLGLLFMLVILRQTFGT